MDSGVERCVCPRGYAPLCPAKPLDADHVPRLVIAAVDPMTVCGYKYVHYTFLTRRCMVVHYLPCFPQDAHVAEETPRPRLPVLPLPKPPGQSKPPGGGDYDIGEKRYGR